MANLKDYYVCWNDTDNPDCDLCDMKRGERCDLEKCPLPVNFFFAKRDNE